LSIEATFIKNEICDLDEWKQAVTMKKKVKKIIEAKYLKLHISERCPKCVLIQ
jgi:hypothetical protein